MIKARSAKSASPAAKNRFERHPRLTLSLVLLGTLAVVILGAEMIARWVHPSDTGMSYHYRIPHPHFGWVLESGASYVNRMPEESIPVSYNAEGFRDRPRTNKPKGVTRVLVLGDSFMEAYSVRFEDALPTRLEQLISTEKRPVEVINFGVGGYSTLQQYLLFKAFGRAYQPDVVVLAMYLDNDLEENSRELSKTTERESLNSTARPFLDPQVGEPDWRVTQVDFEGAMRRYQAYRRRHAEPLNQMLRHSALLQLGQRALKKAGLLKVRGKARVRSSTSKERRYLVNYGHQYCDQPPEFQRAWNVTRRILARLDSEVRAAGARLLVMSVPANYEVEKASMARVMRKAPQANLLCLREAPGNQHLGEVLGELDIDYLDLLQAFRDASQQTGVTIFRADLHWNAQGHALAAQKLAAALERRGYLVRDEADFASDGQVEAR